jgi:hypothetical protein
LPPRYPSTRPRGPPAGNFGSGRMARAGQRKSLGRGQLYTELHSG